MYNFAQIDLDIRKVVGLSQLSGEEKQPHLIPITLEQYNNENYLRYGYYVNNKFEGYYTKLSTDKVDNKIIADGLDKVRIKVELYDLDNALYTGAKTLNVEILETGQAQTVDISGDGIAEIEFSSLEPGTYTFEVTGEYVGSNLIKVVAE